MSFILHQLLHVLGERTRHLDGVDARDEVVDALPLRKPGLLGFGDEERALVHARGASLDDLGGTFEVKERAVGATVFAKVLFSSLLAT